MRLYVGNLAYSTTEDTLRNEFGKFGNVTSALVVIDRVSGRSRGFGFVEFSTPEEGTQAINGMNGTSLDGREIVVNEARERQAGGGGRPGRGGPALYAAGATSFGPSGWNSEARSWICPRPGPSSNCPPPYSATPRSSHQA